MTEDDIIAIALRVFGVSDIITEEDDATLWGRVLLLHLQEAAGQHPGHPFNLLFGTGDAETVSDCTFNESKLWVLERTGNHIYAEQRSRQLRHDCNSVIVISRPSRDCEEAVVASGAYADLDGSLSACFWRREPRTRAWFPAESAGQVMF